MKKWLVAATGLFLALTLAGCSNTVVSTSGGKISQKDYYNELKNTQQGQEVLTQMIISNVLEDQYGKQVSKKDVNKAVADYKKGFEAQQEAQKAQDKNAQTQTFEQYLQSQSIKNESAFKKQIRTNMLMEKAVKANTKTDKKALEAEWKNWEPKITVQHILVKTEDEANAIIKKLDGGANFDKLAKKESQDTGSKENGGKLDPFNKDAQLLEEFKDAAFKLKKDGDYTEKPVKTTAGYHVIKLISKQTKSPKKDMDKDIKKYKSEMIKDLYTKNQSDQTFMQNLIGKLLKKGNVSIKDDDLKDILKPYMATQAK